MHQANAHAIGDFLGSILHGLNNAGDQIVVLDARPISIRPHHLLEEIDQLLGKY
jgi:hypothetical protein